MAGYVMLWCCGVRTKRWRDFVVVRRAFLSRRCVAFRRASLQAS